MASDGLLSARTNPGRDLLAQRVVEISPAVRKRAKAPTADRNAARLWEAAEAVLSPFVGPAVRPCVRRGLARHGLV